MPNTPNFELKRRIALKQAKENQNNLKYLS
jgi:hypothetical protein